MPPKSELSKKRSSTAAGNESEPKSAKKLKTNPKEGLNRKKAGLLKDSYKAICKFKQDQKEPWIRGELFIDLLENYITKDDAEGLGDMVEFQSTILKTLRKELRENQNSDGFLDLLYKIAEKKLSDFHTALHTKPPIPPPSEWAKMDIWPQAQVDAGSEAILCLRPSDQQGLPLVVLHNAFRHFTHCINGDLPRNEEAAATLPCAKALCDSMGDSFENQAERFIAFQDALDPFIHRMKWLPGQEVDCNGTGVKLDRTFKAFKLQLVTKTEGESGDGYMQSARSFQLLLSWMTDHTPQRLQDGAPAFILVVQGPTIMVSGGFYDGKRTTVEPLTPYLHMLSGYLHDRIDAVAKLLYALKFSLDLIPRAWRLMFLGKVTLDGEPKDCLIKLAKRSYGTKVHHYLAKVGLAPTLFGVSEMPGAPLAVAMELLPPHSKGVAGWALLYDLKHVEDKRFTSEEEQGGLKKALYKVLGALEAGSFVHGDLRDTNIMVWVKADGTVLDGAKEVKLKLSTLIGAGKAGK